jgi:hypothetical protein
MKREWLKELGLTDEVLDKIMAENGADIEKVKSKVSTLETERDSYKEQLETANKEINSYKEMDVDGIKASVETWKTKYETDTAEMQKKLSAQAYEFALKEYIGGYKFTSDLVKEAVVAQLKQKEFKLEDGKFLGADDYMKQLKEANPTAFADVEDKQPTITLPTGGANKPQKGMPIAELMKIKNANPEFDITPYL